MVRNPLALALVLAAVAGAACVTSVVGIARQPSSASSRAGPVEAVVWQAPVVPSAVQAAALLREWDGRRAEAWARGEPRVLSGLYTPGSLAGQRDREMLRAWTERGLVVRGLRTQLLAVEELRRSSATWVLRVTDRVAGGVAIGPGVRRALPVDTATTRRIELRRVAGRWLVAAVSVGG